MHKASSIEHTRHARTGHCQRMLLIVVSKNSRRRTELMVWDRPRKELKIHRWWGTSRLK